MGLRNTSSRYGAVTIGLHWLMAILIVAMVVVGLVMTAPPLAERNFELYQLHKSFGLTILVLAAVRLLWRVSNPKPDLPDTMSGVERLLANLTHVALYVLMFALPVSGWIMASASTLQVPTLWFGVFQVPHVVPPDADLEKLAKAVHGWLGWAIIGAFALHVAGALKHHFVERDDVLRRMLPGSGNRRP